MMKIVTTNIVASRPPNGDRLQCRPLVTKTLYDHAGTGAFQIQSCKHDHFRINHLLFSELKKFFN